MFFFFFFSSRRRHTRLQGDWSSDVCSSDLEIIRRGGIVILAFILALATSTISGVVKDSSGGVVSGAAVIVRPASGGEQRGTTGPDGRFAIESAATGGITVGVRAGGLAGKNERI